MSLIAFIGLLALSSPVDVAETTQASFDSNGVRIHYATAGAGRPVILIHGWMGDATMWGRGPDGKPMLSPPPGIQVIAMDCRGHGSSDKPHDPADYGVQMARDVVRLMDLLKIRRADLVGYSMGAFIAGAVAAWFPNRVSGVIFGGQAPLLRGAPSSGSREVEVFADAVKAGKGMGPYFIEITPTGGRKPSLDQANRFAESYFRGKDVQAFAAAGLSLDRLEIDADRLRKCEAPMLFLHGSNESPGVLRRIDFAEKALPKCRRIVIESANHITAPANPKFGEAIVDFVTRGKV